MCWDVERFPVFRVFGNAGAHNHPMQISQSASFSEARTAKVATLLLSVLALVLSAMLAPPLLAQYTAGSPVVLGGTNDSGTFATSISGTSTVTKSGTGMFTLTGTNTYTGNTIISGGTLTAGGTQAFGTGSIVSLVNTDGALLDLNGYSNSIGALVGGGTLGGNVGMGAGTLTIAIPPSGLKGVIAAAAETDFSLFLRSDGAVFAVGADSVGSNSTGQFGDASKRPRTVPVQVMTGVTSMVCNGSRSLLLKSDGSVWGTGDNTDGRIGDGSNVNKLNPVQVMVGVQSVACGGAHALFLKNDGNVWACGWNGYGQLGTQSTSTKLSPVQVIT